MNSTADFSKGICERARQYGARSVVVGNSGGSSRKDLRTDANIALDNVGVKAHFGSVASGLVHLCSCPVTVVKTKTINAPFRQGTRSFD